MTLAADVGRFFVQNLAGLPTAWPPLVDVAQLVERSASGADVAQDAIAHAQAHTLAVRLQAAVRADAVSVSLPDQTTLSLAEAERQLALKEADRVFLGLRLPYERAVRDALSPLRAARAFEQALPVPAGLVVAEAPCTHLRSFLARSTDTAAAAREFLAQTGRAPVTSEAALRRILDLPEPGLFSLETIVAAVRLAAERTPLRRPVARTSAPRVLAGHVVDDGEVVRLFVAPSWSAGRHLALASGAGVVVAASVLGTGHAAGIGLALVDESSRRTLGHSRGEARRAFAITAATALLHARARAAVALARAMAVPVLTAHVGGQNEGAADASFEAAFEAARAGCRAALLGDAGMHFLERHFVPAWPDGRRLDTNEVVAVDDALFANRMARSWRFLRDHLDEGFLARRGGLAALQELPVLPADGEEDARAWSMLLGELL
jgi:hypothetical protein